MYKRRDILVVPFPFADSNKSRKRPALVISNGKVNNSGDYMLIQITSKEKEDDLSVEIFTQDFEESPLPLKSYVRSHKIFLLNESLILYKMTSVKDSFLEKIVRQIISLIE
jgi:mRNA interferase MazF